MTDFGVIPTGFNRKLLGDILKSIQDRHRISFGAEIDVAIATELGQLDGNFASELAEVWELLEEAYHGFDVEAAADYLLTALASLTGTGRKPAAPSKVQGVCNLNAGATAPAGSIVYVTGRQDIQFTLDTAVTNSGGSPADIPANATASQTGPIVVTSGTSWTIQTPASGWNSFSNPSHDAIVGRNVETDIELRQRMIDELAIRGGSTLRAIRADLLNFEEHPELINIRSVDGLENTGDVVDSNGLPPHSVEMLIDDGDTPTTPVNDIAQVIFDSKAGGINTSGSTSGTAQDDNGDLDTIFFSYPTLRPIFLVYTLDKTSDYPIDGDTQIKNLILAAGAKLRNDDDVIALEFKAIPLQVAGVRDVTAFTLGFGASPVGTTNLTIGLRERATFDGTNISIS